MTIHSRYGIALTLALFTGCGSGDETDMIKLVPVSGTVTLNGKPLQGASITFTPGAGTKLNTPGNDTSGPEGNYKVMYRGRSGLAPGKYKVVVSKTIESASTQVPENAKDNPVLAAMEKQKSLMRQQIKSGKKGVATAIEESFDREVSEKGEILDFDLKGITKKL